MVCRAIIQSIATGAGRGGAKICCRQDNDYVPLTRVHIRKRAQLAFTRCCAIKEGE